MKVGAADERIRTEWSQLLQTGMEWNGAELLSLKAGVRIELSQLLEEGASMA